MKESLLDYIVCPKCNFDLYIEDQKSDEIEIISGELKCVNCGEEYKIEHGMPLLYNKNDQWNILDLEAKGWVNIHKDKGIYDQTGNNIDYILPYYDGKPWLKVGSMFDICFNILDLDGSEKILDIGAARGWASKHFSLRGCYSVSIDIVADDQIGLGRSKSIMKEANTYYERVIGDSGNLPFGKETFDIVFCSGALHHTLDIDNLFNNINKVLKPGGMLIAINEPCAGIFMNTDDVISDMEESKYDINETLPNLITYHRGLSDSGFSNINIFPYQVYNQTEHEFKEWYSNFKFSEVFCGVYHYDFGISGNDFKEKIYRLLIEHGGETIVTAIKK